MADDDVPTPESGRKSANASGFMAGLGKDFRSMCDDVEALSPGKRFAFTFVFGALAAGMILCPDDSSPRGQHTDCLSQAASRVDAPRTWTKGPVTSFCMGTVRVDVPGRFEVDGKSETLARGTSGRWSETLDLSGSGSGGEDRVVKITVESQGRR